jgi:non-ribosomal peptide synthetase component F
VLRRCSGDRDVVFGVTVAGRPVSLPQMQRTVGLFINSIALRVQFPRPGSAQRAPVVAGLLDSNMQLREYEYLPLVAIQECSELPKGQPLFDSLFVFENARWKPPCSTTPSTSTPAPTRAVPTPTSR